MKVIAVIFILSCLSLCIVNSERVQRWGYVGSTKLGEKTIVAAPMKGNVRVHAFSFSGEIRPNLKIPITGIKHIDYADRPVNVTFIYGEVMRQDVAILLKSEVGHGINSTFIFYRM